MSRIINFIKNYPFEIFLFLVVLVLCICNYSPNTFLTGWDNLHPEFNIWANLKRSIFSTWQEYQGLGLMAGMAHAADLVRQLIILPFTYILPTNLIRYFWHFSMLFLGTFGLFRLGFYITKNKYSPLIAALFYLLNFGTVQYFYLPFDPYSTFWGFFPWLIYYLFLYLEKPKSLKKLFLINLLATPSFYVQTLFVVYIICISLILFIHFLSNRHLSSLKLYSTIVLSLFFINAFWLLPNIYFTFTRFSITQNSMQNLMVTDQFVEQNLYRGNIPSFSLLQGQYYDIKRYITPSNFQYIMKPWHEHLDSIPPQIIGYLLTIISLLAIFVKNKYPKYILAILLFCLIGALSATFPFDQINNLVRHIPLIDQIFRNSFTKLLVPTVFCLSILLSISLSHFKKINLIFIPIIIFLSWPSFQGNFIYPKIRANIPTEYFELTKYLNTIDSSKRIMDLPQYNYWGWSNYLWGGASGSGFLWYGIDQPITSRTFDVWDDHLENYFWQLRYAIISRNSEYFQFLIEKYNISYILFDSSLFFLESHNSGKVTLENQKLLDDTPNLQLEKQFGNLKLYRVTTSKDSVTTFTQLPNLNVPHGFNYLDQAFINYSHYQNNPRITFNDSFPNINLFSNHPDQPIDIDSISKLIPPLQWSSCLSSTPKQISAINQENITFFNCGDDLDLSQGYLVKINSQNFSNRPFLIKFFSLTDYRLIIDSRLNPTQKISYFIIPPIYPFDTGLGINFSSLSFSQNPSVNQVDQVDISPLNWQYISNQHFKIASQSLPPQSVDFHQSNQTFYQVKLNQTNPTPTHLTLFQSYNPGWLAFYIKNFQIKFLDHYQINNWANGWNIQNIYSKNVYILFWPQLLQFLGFTLLIGSIVWIIKRIILK